MTTQALNTIRAYCCILADLAAAPLEFPQKVQNTRPVRTSGSAQPDFGRFPADNPVTSGGSPGAGRKVHVGRFPSPRPGVKPSSASGGRV